MKVVTLVQEIRFGQDKMIRTRVWVDKIESATRTAGLWENRESFANYGSYKHNEIMTMNSMLVDIWAQFVRDFGPVFDQCEFIHAAGWQYNYEMSDAQRMIAMNGGREIVSNRDIK